MSDKYYVLSTPNYTLGTHDLGLIRNELARKCCDSCYNLYLEEFGEHPETTEDYLWTPCGAEYSVDEFDTWEDYVKYFKENF